MRRLLPLLIFAVAALAQTAKVVQLSRRDAAHAREIYEAKQKADAAWDALQEDIEHRYVSDAVEGGLIMSSITLSVDYRPKPGWLNGFEFAEGFRFIVPKAPPVTPVPHWYCGPTFAPAIGTLTQTADIR